MLATCTRCRQRRVKCDSRLPACASCAKADVECTFRDEALQEDVPRSYIQSLNQRIESLNAQLALYRPESASPEICLRPSSASTSASQVPSRILVPEKAGSDLRLDYSIPSLFAKVAFEALPSAENPRVIEETINGADQIPVNPLACSERSHLTPATLRFLLGRYDSCVRPCYNVPIPACVNPDESSFKKLDSAPKFKLLLACAIAAAREAYRDANWKPIAQICRNWACELVTPVMVAGDRDTLVAILLLLIYELVDPIRGTTWELLDLAARTCLQLGWHQVAPAQVVPSPGSAQTELGRDSTCNADDLQLLKVLRDIEMSLRTIVSRPNILMNTRLPTASENENVYDLYAQIHNQLHGQGQIFATRACPFVGEISSLLALLGTLPSDNHVVAETWLCFVPVCFKHKQCIFCVQEADDEDSHTGMLSLRNRVVQAAISLIGDVHHKAITQDQFVPPLIACSRTFVAGCALATAIAKKWTPLGSHTRELIWCSTILAKFASCWTGGADYSRVWSVIIDLIYSGPTT